MRLFELNTNPQPGGGMCVLCGGSVRFVVDTDVEPLLTRSEWEASVDSKRHETMLHRWTGRLLHGAGQYSDPSTVEVATKSQAMLRAALGVEGDGDEG